MPPKRSDDDIRRAIARERRALQRELGFFGVASEGVFARIPSLQRSLRAARRRLRFVGEDEFGNMILIDEPAGLIDAEEPEMGAGEGGGAGMDDLGAGMEDGPAMMDELAAQNMDAVGNWQVVPFQPAPQNFGGVPGFRLTSLPTSTSSIDRQREAIDKVAAERLRLML